MSYVREDDQKTREQARY